MRALLVLLTALVAAPALGQVPIEIRLPEVTVRPGADVVVPVTVETSLTGRDVRSVTIVLRYNSPAVRAVGVETDGTLADDLGSATSSIDPVAREVRVAAAGGEPLEGTGVLFRVRFRGESPGTVGVSFDPDESLLNEGEPPLDFTDGRITVESLPTVRLSPSSAVLLVGESATFTASGGAAPYTFGTVEPSIATVDAAGVVTALAPGTTRLTATDADGTPATTEPLIDVRGFDLSTEDVDAGQGEAVEVPLLVTSLDGLDVRSGEIVLTLASSIARIVGVETGGTLLDGASVTLGTEGDRYRIAFASGATIMGAGTLLILRVETAPDGRGTAGLSAPEVPVLNEDLLGLARGLGVIRVTPPPTLSVSPARPEVLAGETVALTAAGAAGPVTWTTADPGVATVAASGVVTGVGSGTTTITATDDETGGQGTADITVYGVEFDLGDVAASPGGTVTLPVAFRSPLGEGVESIEGRFSVDRPDVAVVGVRVDGRLADGWFFETDAAPDGSVEFAGAGPAISSDGVFLDLVVTVAGSALPGASAARVSDLVLNEGTPTARTVGGTVTVVEGNLFPVAQPDNASTSVGTSVLVDVLANDSDPDGDPLTITSVSDPPDGTAAVESGQVRYTPDAGFAGVDGFTYTISDGQGGTDEASVAVTVAACVAPRPGAIAWWSLDESGGTTAADLVGSNAGTHTNGPLPGGGLVDGALTFDGTNDFVSVADSDLWAFGDSDFTLELWASFDAPGGSIGTPGDVFLASNDGTGTRNKWFFGLGGGVLLFHINGPSVGPVFLVQAPFDPTLGQWYHLAVTRSGSTYTIFVDGEAVGSQDDARTIPNANSPLVIGAANEGFGGFMNGGLDEVTIYTQALAEADLRDIVDARSAGKCKPAGNANPTAADDAAVTDEDTAVLIDVLANDDDPDGDPLTISSVSDPASGSAAVESDVVRYSPDAGFVGTDVFTYTVSDGNGGTDEATVSVTVRPAGSEPTTYTWTGAADGLWATPGNWSPAGIPTAVDTALVAGGPDVLVEAPAAVARLALSEGRVDAAAALTAGQLALTGGELVVGADIAVTDFEWTGAVPSQIGGTGSVRVDDAATIAVQDGTLAGASLVLQGASTLAPFVRGSDNVASLALADGALLEVASGAELAVSATGDSEDTGEVSVFGVGDGASSRLVVREGAVLRSVGPGVVGVSGNLALETAGTLDLVDGEWVVRFAGSAPGRFVHTGEIRGTGTLSLPLAPTLSLADHFLNGGVTAPGAGGALTVTTDYRIPADPAGRLAVTLGPTPGDVDPLAVSGEVTLGGVLDVAFEEGFTPNAGETYEVLTYGSRVGTFEGVVLPDLGSGLRTEVAYGPTDAAGSVVLRVLPPNAPPVAVADVAATDEDVAVTIAVLDNDSDPDGDALTVTAVSQPSAGTTTTTGETVTYTPAPDANGGDAFTYTVSDGNGGEATGTVTVTVRPVNDAPVARADEAATAFETPVAIDVLANDTDVDGDVLTVTEVTAPTNGSASVGVGGLVSYSPASGFSGEDVFTYTVADGAGGAASALVTVAVAPPNTPPLAADDATTTSAGTPVTVDVLSNDSDPDGDPLAVRSVGTPARGTATTDGTAVTYTPAVGTGGADAFTYTVSDGRGGEATATVRVVVTQMAGGLTRFTRRGDFDAAAPGLAVQTFEAATPGVACAPVLDADTDDACVNAGDILPGIRFEGEAVGGDLGREVTFRIVDPSASRSWTGNALLLDDTEAQTVLTFPDGTTALGLDVHNLVAAPGTFVLTLEGVDGAPLGTLTLDVTSEAPSFVGVTSSEAIGRAVLDEFPPLAAGGAAEVLDAIAFVSSAVPPTVTTAPNTPPSAGAPSTVDVEPGGVVPIAADLFYRITGRVDYASVPISLVDGRYRAEVPAAAVTPRGFDYYVRISDGRVVVTDPADDPERAPRHVRVTTAPQAAAVATPRDGTYRMVSVPVALDDAALAAVFADDFGPYDPARWRLLRWDPEGGAYVEFGDPGVGAVEPGQGFWLAARGEGAAPFDVEGGRSVDASAPVEIELPPGWSQIGTPFAFPVDWDDVLGAASIPAPVGYDGVEYVPGQTVLEPWRAVFVENPADTVVTIAVPPLEAGEGGERRAGARLGPARYALHLSATAGGRFRDTHNVVGFAEGATTGRDVLDWGEPPPVGEFVRLSIVEDGTPLSRSLLPPGGGGGAWDLALSASAGALASGPLAVVVALDDLAPLPSGFARYVLDLDRGAALPVVDGRVRVTLSAERPSAPLRVIVGTEAFARVAAEGASLAPADFSLEPPRPNPSVGAVRIDYVVAAAGSVTVEVFDAVGRRVVVLTEGEHEAGVHAVTWEPDVSAGAYLIRLRSGAFHATRAVAIVR